MKTIKRGEMSGHFLSIVIGVVCLGILLFATWRFMHVYTTTDHEKAVNALKTIERKLKALDGAGTTLFPLQGPVGWYLQGWSVSEEGRPDRCYFKSCICICKEAGRQGAASCQDSKTGTCVFVKERELFVGSELYSLGYDVSVGGGGNVPTKPTPWVRSETRVRCSRVFLGGGLVEFRLTHEQDRVELIYVSDEQVDFSQEAAGCKR